MPIVRPVILSGGSGTRLWPLSTPSLPKQFVHLLPGGTLFTQTLERLSGIEGVAPPVIVTGADYADRASAAAKDMTRGGSMIVNTMKTTCQAIAWGL